MSNRFKLRSTSDTDTSVYEIDTGVALSLLLDWELHNVLMPDLEFRNEVIVNEDGVPKVYAASNLRHSGWGLKAEFIDPLPPLWLEFVRTAP
jgi:hypothetical protein